MWNLPKKIKLAENPARSLPGGILTVPQRDGGSFSCRVPEMTMDPDGSFLLPLENEHSQLGRGLVQALWFQREVQLWLPGDGIQTLLTLAPWRCHIAGPLFAEVLTRARQADPAADPTAVWELYPIREEQTPLPAPVPQTIVTDLPAQHHLDHCSMHPAQK